MNLKSLKNKDTMCNMKLKELTPIFEKDYIQGDEVSVKEIIKSSITCIPKDIFRYLMLFVAEEEKKMQIYFFALRVNRMDLLSSIRGLTTKDYKIMIDSYKNTNKEDIKRHLYNEYRKAAKRENVKKHATYEKKKTLSLSYLKKQK